MIYGIVERNDRTMVKIGFTEGDHETEKGRRALLQRIGALAIGNWRELACIALAHGTMSDERELHALYARYRVRGEWFRHEGDVREWTKRNRASAAIVRKPNSRGCKWPRFCGCARCKDVARRFSEPPIANENRRSIGLSDAEMDEWLEESLAASARK